MDKRFFGIVVVLLAWFFAGLVSQEAFAASERALIVIDPAHGGQDTGVVTDKLLEKNITLELALLIRQEAQNEESFHVQLLRETDRSMTTAERIKAVGAATPACLISLHVNAGFGRKAEGYEVYFPGFQQNDTSSGDAGAILKDMTANQHLNDSVRLAQRIQAALEKVFPRKGRGLRDAPNTLLEGVNTPGLVVEVGFATQPEERVKLTDTATQRTLARAIVQGLGAYFQKAP